MGILLAANCLLKTSLESLDYQPFYPIQHTFGYTRFNHEREPFIIKNTLGLPIQQQQQQQRNVDGLRAK